MPKIILGLISVVLEELCVSGFEGIIQLILNLRQQAAGNIMEQIVHPESVPGLLLDDDRSSYEQQRFVEQKL